MAQFNWSAFRHRTRLVDPHYEINGHDSFQALSQNKSNGLKAKNEKSPHFENHFDFLIIFLQFIILLMHEPNFFFLIFISFKSFAISINLYSFGIHVHAFLIPLQIEKTSLSLSLVSKKFYCCAFLSRI